MNLLVAMDHRFDRTPDGAVWSWFFDGSFWERYLDVFAGVRILARMRDVACPADVARRSDGPRVQFVPVPFYLGPLQYARRWPEIQRAIRTAVRPDEAVLLRAGHLANCLGRVLRKRGHPYGMEVISDFHDVFAPGTNRHPLRPFLRWWYPRQVRALCRDAAAVAYVTAQTLQKRYPPGPGTYAAHYSSIDLSAEALAARPRAFRAPARDVVTVGTMDMPYKGHDVLIRALAVVRQNGGDLRLTIAGDGRFRPRLEALVRELHLTDRVAFLGMLGRGAPVRALLDRADLFVLPSLTEGLPRALIEALARGLPCLASAIGGIPELLEPEDLVPPGDVAALARQLCAAADDLPRLNRMATRNFRKAQDYRLEVLSARRQDFYRRLADATRRGQADIQGTP